MITPSVSIVINTLNRSSVLEKTLQSLVWLRYRGDFEVVVVNGPSIDNTQEVLSRWRDKVRIADCPTANLSMSRNIGISMARGDIIAFLDDDAIPEPEWLEQLTAAYSDPSVGAAGGFVYDHTGYNFQYKYCTVDRFGNADLSAISATPQYSFPKSYNIPHLLGCNSSFRRNVLLHIGGFDEEYEYFLDETDLCIRIVDAGYLITQLPNAYVHHKYAPSNIRGENKATRNRFPIVKNKVYFILKHSLEFHSIDIALEEINNFIVDQKRDVLWCEGEGLLSSSDAEQFSIDVSKALEIGLRRGLQIEPNRKFITDASLAQYDGAFLKFGVNGTSSAKNIVLISRDFPPEYGGASQYLHVISHNHSHGTETLFTS
ncbi:glycosyltransferase [Ochrobactrum pseudogrignonense]|nr:glycosyltransferase [Brucella pseudogrignonensis]